MSKSPISLEREIARLEAEVKRLLARLQAAVWSDTEYCKLLERINDALINVPTIDVDVVVPLRDYDSMSRRDCYEAGLMDGVLQARTAFKYEINKILQQ